MTVADIAPTIALRNRIQVGINATLNLTMVLLSIFILIPRTWSVPLWSENVYVLRLAQQYQTTPLSKDWSFQSLGNMQFVFNHVFGFLPLVYSLETTIWVGRILAWTLLVLGLFQIGRCFRLPLWMTSLMIALWLHCGQSLVGNESILGTFEPKSIAYIFLFLSLTNFVEQRDWLAACFLGCTLSFHPAVGLWSGLAMSLPVLMLRWDLSRLLKIAGVVLIFALPGIIPAWVSAFGSASFTTEDVKFFTSLHYSSHMNPFYFGRWPIILLYSMLIFNVHHFTMNYNDEKLRFLILFELGLAIGFSVGLIFWFTENYQVIKFMPFRLFPLLIPLFFLMHLGRVLRASFPRPIGKAFLPVFGVLVFTAYDGRFHGIMERVTIEYRSQTQDDDIKRALQWIAKNTPVDSISILPPWRVDSAFYSQRPQIANWHTAPLDYYSEWRERMRSLVGNVTGEKKGSVFEEMKMNYDRLTRVDIAAIRQKYGGDYLVSEADHAYPILFQAGRYRVYLLNSSIK